MFQRIQYRILFIFVLSITFFLILTGVVIHWTIQRSLEKTLGEKLSTVAQSCVALFESSEIQYYIENPGTRLEERIRNRLKVISNLEDIKRIFLFDESNLILLDIHNQNNQIPGPDLYFFQSETETLRKDGAVYSILFQGIDGLPSMTGFAAIFDEKKYIAGIGIEGSANFLNDLQVIQRQLIFIGIFGIIISIFLGVLLSNTITKPIRVLASHSKFIAKGDYDTSISLNHRDELGALASVMEDMRQNVLSREKELKAMLAGVAHEIRNPLGGMSLFTDLLAETVPSDSTEYTHVQRIQKEIKHLQDVVHRFLDFARPTKPSMQKTDISPIIQECIDLDQELIKQKKIMFKIHNFESPIIVYADPNHIKEILMNLKKNGVEAVPENGSIEIEVVTIGDKIKIRMIDSGKGISKEHQEKIFDPFYTTRNEGTGLGLSIAKALAKSNGGDVILEKSDNNGTVFSVYLRMWEYPALSA